VPGSYSDRRPQLCTASTSAHVYRSPRPYPMQPSTMKQRSFSPLLTPIVCLSLRSSAPSVECHCWELQLPPHASLSHRQLVVTSSQADCHSESIGCHAMQSASSAVRTSSWAAISGQGVKPAPLPHAPGSHRVAHRLTHQRYQAANRARATGRRLQSITAVAKPFPVRTSFPRPP
jgi:hypothetical protein